MAWEREDFVDDLAEAEEVEPGIGWNSFGNALSAWVWMQARNKSTVREASVAFNTSDAVIQAAVQDHMWMFITGPDDDPSRQIIEHDGE